MTNTQKVALAEARDQLGDLVTRAQYSGQITVITRHGRDAAALIPLDLLPTDLRTAEEGDVTST